MRHGHAIKRRYGGGSGSGDLSSTECKVLDIALAESENFGNYAPREKHKNAFRVLVSRGYLEKDPDDSERYVLTDAGSREANRIRSAMERRSR